VFRHAVGAKAYMWKSTEMKWELIGDVQMPKQDNAAS
jgi:phospholipase A-2-activating protein